MSAALPHDEAGSGDAVVLLHAGIADRAMWAALLPAIAAAGFRAVALDLPGFGKAPAETAVQAPWSAVLRAMDALGIERATLVGSSFGGAVALRVAVVAPERVAALVLVSAPDPSLDPSPELQAAWEAEEAALERGDVDAAVAGVLATWLLPDAPPDLRDYVAACQRRAFALQADAGDVPEAPDPLDERPDALAAIDVPALVAVGEHDMRDFHEGASALAEALGAGTPLMIAGAGHLAPLERPAEFEALLLRFLRDLR